MAERSTSSFRDASGYIAYDGQNVQRIINPIYFSQYSALSQSGFYEQLFNKKYLVPHLEISSDPDKIVLLAEKIPFISYPYEWSFLQYKHAALLTLKIQKTALAKGFSLKDASAFNVTFHRGKPIFIDTLSFDFYTDNAPWHAYGQFIRHFLGPLVLASYFGPDMLKSLASDIDGIPLKRLSAMLPWRSFMSPTIVANIHLLARYEGKKAKEHNKKARLSQKAQLRLIDSLYVFIRDLKAEQATEWDRYYSQLNYSDSAYSTKKQLTKEWFAGLKNKKILDLGGNDGTFARELSQEAEFLLVADVDANAVGQNYRRIAENKETNILPIVADILNPAAGYGFLNQERHPFIERVAALQLSGCLALALIHHISLSGNVPFDFSARFFARLAPNLLIEFPTRDDSWVKFLLKSKREFEDHFDFYNAEAFERSYSAYFEIVEKRLIPDSARIFYSMKRKINNDQQ